MASNRWLSLRNKNYVTGRIELVDKDELLGIAAAVFELAAYTGGYTRDFYLIPYIATGLGANITAYSMPAALNPIYGRRPVMALVFVRFRLRGGA